MTTLKVINFALSGERGIRTPGASQHAGSQDRCNRPLYHLSERPFAPLSGGKNLEKRCKGTKKSEKQKAKSEKRKQKVKNYMFHLQFFAFNLPFPSL